MGLLTIETIPLNPLHYYATLGKFFQILIFLLDCYSLTTYNGAVATTQFFVIDLPLAHTGARTCLLGCLKMRQLQLTPVSPHLLKSPQLALTNLNVTGVTVLDAL